MTERRDEHDASPLGTVSRRRLLQRAAAGAALLGLPAGLVACGGEQPAAPTAQAPSQGSPPPSGAATPGPAASPTSASPGAAAPAISGGVTAEPGGPTPAEPAASPAAAPAASPIASPEASPVAAADPQERLQRFMAVSASLVGGGRLDPQRGAQFLSLVDANPSRRAALDALLASAPATAPAPTNPASPAAVASLLAVTPAATPGTGARGAQGNGGATSQATPIAAGIDRDILTFWYRGVYDGQPVPDRAAFWFSLSAWQGVRYTAATSICKGFGEWSRPPAVT